MNSKTVALICAVLICVAGVLWMANAGQGSGTTLAYSQSLDKVRTGQVASVMVMGSDSGAVQTICRLKDGSTVRTVLPAEYGAVRLAINATPLLLLLGVWIFPMIRKFPKGPRQGVLG